MTCWTSLPQSVFKIPSHFRHNILQISSKAEHACASNTIHKIACWGVDRQGETVIPTIYEYVNHITTGLYKTCVVLEDRYSLECWGNDNFTLKNNGKQINQIGLGNSFMYALNDEGMYFCGLLQNDENILSELDQPSDFTNDIKHMSAMRTICAVKNSGDLGCWDPKSRVFAEIIPKQKRDIRVVETNQYKTCVITVSNALKCWAQNLKPYIPADFRENITTIYTKGPIICAVRVDKLLNCWIAYEKHKEPMIEYKNAYSTSIQFDPSNLPSIKIQVLFQSKELVMVKTNDFRYDIPSTLKTDILQIDSGRQHSCAIKEIAPTNSIQTLTTDTGTLGCWGDNHFGESAVPSSFAQVSTLALGDHHTCAITPRIMACWGNNQFGQTTVPVAFRKAYSVLTTSHTCALAHMGSRSTIGCWGNNLDSQTTVPQQVQGGSEGGGKRNSNSNLNEMEDGELQIVKKEIVKLMTGHHISGGVDTEGELHLWGKKENTVIPDKQKQGNYEGISNELTCVLRGDKSIGCFGKILN